MRNSTAFEFEFELRHIPSGLDGKRFVASKLKETVIA